MRGKKQKTMSWHTLMFGWEYPPVHCGGLGVACQGIVRGLLHHGAKVTLVLPHDASEENGVTILSPDDLGSETIIPIRTKLKPYDSWQTFSLRLSTEGSEPAPQLYGDNLGAEVERYTAVATELTKKIRPDIVHTHDWMTLEAGVRASAYHRKPMVAHVHATELDRTEFKPNCWIMRREIQGLKKADHVIAVSGYTKNILMREYGIPEDKITVLHNGTFDTRPFPRLAGDSKRHPLVLFLGRLTVQKGVTYFLRAAKNVHEIDPAVRFVVAGEGYLLPQLIQETFDLGLTESMIFAGRVTNEEARKLYARTDCFVMPSVSEPFGLVALEAITHGAPVVLSRQSGVSEVVRNSMIVDFWDIDKMADSILTVLREKPLRSEMRAQTGRVLSNLTWHRQAGKILAVYDKLTINN